MFANSAFVVFGTLRIKSFTSVSETSVILEVYFCCLNSLHNKVIFHAFLSSAEFFFFEINFLKKFFQEYHWNVKLVGL